MEVVLVVLVGVASHMVVFPGVGVVKGVGDGEVRIVVEMVVALAADTCHAAVFPCVEVVEDAHEVEGNTVEDMAVLKVRAREAVDTWHAAVSRGDEVGDDVCERAGVLYGKVDRDGHERGVQVRGQGS
ncbi:hypothetical protein MLD38_008371 [Melastoma candidum]|nr:hypothetical protein MLD38_008371 [Melastoma candidum]